MSGTVYVLTNDSLKGMVKVGFTTRSATIRAKELSTTSLPTPFVVAYESETVPNARTVERQVHADLVGSRIQNGREFFKVTTTEAIAAIEAAIAAQPGPADACKSSTQHVVTVQVPDGVTEVVIRLEKLGV